MTQEQYEKCQAWEQQLRWAVRSNFVHMSNGEFSDIAALYKEVFDEALTVGQMTCNTCRLKALKRLGNEYFGYQQQIAEEQKEERLVENGNEAQTKTNKGRKKKIDIE